MAQIIQERRSPSFGQKFSNAVGVGLQGAQQLYQQHQEREALRGALGEEGANLPRDFQKMAYESKLKQQQEAAKFQGEQGQLKILEDTFGKKFADIYKTSSEGGRTQLLTHALDAVQRGEDLAGIINYAEQSNRLNSSNEIDQGPKKPRGITPAEWSKQRSTQLYDINKPVLKEISDMRKNIPIQEQAIEDLMESSEDVGIRDWLADYFEFEPLRSESGAKFKTAVKDFFLSDVSRVGARPNLWVEQQLFSALPMAGRSAVSNQITTAGLRFKKDLAKKRIELIDELSDKYGYSEIDLDKTANKMMKSYVQERQDLLEAEIKNIKNREKGLSGRLIEVLGPDGELYEVDESEVELLPEGFLIK